MFDILGVSSLAGTWVRSAADRSAPVHRVFATLGALAALAIGTPGFGQVSQERENAQLRKDCRLARGILEKGPPHPHWKWALEVIGSCDESGGEVIPALWQDRTGVTEELEQLVWSSAKIRDRRIMDAVMDVASDPAQALNVRLSALQVLAYYYSPRVYVTLEMLDLPEETEGGRPSIGSTFDFEPLQGGEPLRDEAPAMILEFLRQLSGTARDPVVRGAAEHLAAQLASGRSDRF